MSPRFARQGLRLGTTEKHGLQVSFQSRVHEVLYLIHEASESLIPAAAIAALLSS